MERIKWRKQSVVNRRMEIAYGPDPDPKNIWRDSYRRDPPPSLGGHQDGGGGGGRGTKKKGSARPAGADGGLGGVPLRNVRRRQTRKQKSSLDNLA